MELSFALLKESLTVVKNLTKDIKDLAFKKAVLALEEQIFELEKENFELKQALSKQQEFNMKFEDNLCWNYKSDGTKEGPYCSVCWYDKNKAIPMNSVEYGYSCRVCKNYVDNDEPREAPRISF